MSSSKRKIDCHVYTWPAVVEVFVAKAPLHVSISELLFFFLLCFSFSLSAARLINLCVVLQRGGLQALAEEDDSD